MPVIKVETDEQAMQWLAAGARAKRCPECGADFIDTGKGNCPAIFCEPHCRWRNRSRIWWQKNRRRPVVEKACQLCGKAFKTSNTLKTYCCDAHAIRAAGFAKRKAYDPKGCVGCGVRYLPIHSMQRYCTKRCAKRTKINARRHAKTPEEMQMWLTAGIRAKKCDQCQVRFIDSHPRNESVYCSDKCRHKSAYTRNKQEQPTYDRQCPHCGTMFSTKSKVKLYCTAKHRDMAWQQRRVRVSKRMETAAE